MNGAIKPAKVGSTTGAADNNVGVFVIFVECFFGFKAYNGLVQQHLIEYGAEYVAVAVMGDGSFDRF